MAKPLCPKCNATLNHLTIAPVTGKAPTMNAKSIIFAYPYCAVAISAQIDPLALAEHLGHTKKRT
jgi:hypothetical protein